MTPEARTTRRISRRWPILSSSVAILAVLGLGALVFARGNTPFDADAEWMEEIFEERNPFWDIAAIVMNFLGGGWFAIYVVPIGAIIVLCILRHFWTALYVGLASAVSAGLVQVLKAVFDRPRPEQLMIATDEGSFPSGHVANAATLAVVLGFILWRAWVWAAGAVYVVLMMISRTYLGAHWLSDTIGGLILGAAVAIIVWAPLANRMRVERDAKRQ